MTSDIQIALLADDLTGALDAIAPFANRGLRCVVATGPHSLAAALTHPADVVAVSTNSREASVEFACAANQLAADMLKSVRRVFKKIDSRMKGHVAAEVAVLARQRGLKRVLLCPAIPEMRRVVVAGHVQGFGLDQPKQIANSLLNCPDLDVWTPDALTDDQIDRILAKAGDDILLVGARGLAAGVARRMTAFATNSPRLSLPRPVAFAIGSVDPITLAQVAELRRSDPDAVFVAAPNGIFNGTFPPAKVAILQATHGVSTVSAAIAAAALAQSFVRLFVPGRAGLVLTGGETAAAVLSAMNVNVLRVLGEVSPGLPLCQPLDYPDPPLILTKSGGFGARDGLSGLL